MDIIQTIEKYHEQHPELRAAWDKEAGLIIVDDIYDTHPGFDFGPQGNYYDERREATQKAFLKVIADRKDDGAPIMIIHSRVHEEDVLRISAEDSDVIAVIEATMGVPAHMLGSMAQHIASKPEVWGGDPEWDLDDGAPIVIIQSRVHDEDGPHGLLISELDYSYLTPTHICGVHPYCFKVGQWAEIVALHNGPRPVFMVMYGDGAADSVPLCDLKNYITENRS